MKPGDQIQLSDDEKICVREYRRKREAMQIAIENLAMRMLDDSDDFFEIIKASHPELCDGVDFGVDLDNITIKRVA